MSERSLKLVVVGLVCVLVGLLFVPIPYHQKAGGLTCKLCSNKELNCECPGGWVWGRSVAGEMQAMIEYRNKPMLIDPEGELARRKQVEVEEINVVDVEPVVTGEPRDITEDELVGSL